RADVTAGIPAAASDADSTAGQAVLQTTVTANVRSHVSLTARNAFPTRRSSDLGSYTFTAVLDTIPIGYANSGNYTATVEVVVSSPTGITGCNAVPGVDASLSGAATYADAAAVQAVLPTTVTANEGAEASVTSWT